MSRKEIEVTSTGMVIARVISNDGHVSGLEFFNGVFSSNKSVKRSCRRAHAWADERIKLVDKEETGK